MLLVGSKTCAKALWQGLVSLMSSKEAGAPEQVGSGRAQPCPQRPLSLQTRTCPWAPTWDGYRTGEYACLGAASGLCRAWEMSSSPY